MEFCLARNTVCICIIDQPNTTEVKKVVFFGDIPNNIRKIINKRDFDNNEGVMKDHFGKRWKEKLHLRYNTKSIKTALLSKKDKHTTFMGQSVHQGKAQRKASNRLTGGQDDISERQDTNQYTGWDGGLNIDLDNVTDVKLTSDTSLVKDVDYDQKITYVTNVILFPEDTLWTLREKIYVATGIPIYRQYIYKRARSIDPTVQLPAYSIFINETQYTIDTKNDTEMFNGIYIDKNMYNNRDNLRIKTKEPYKMIDSMLIDDIYLVDLHFYKRAITGIESIIKSTYASDVLFFGLFKKYYPLFDKEMMIKYFTDENEVLNDYPLINTKLDKLIHKFDVEKSILLSVYNNVDSYFNRFADSMELSISEITYKLLDSYSVQNGIFIRNLVDLFPCDADHPFVECYNTKNNVKYRIVRSYKNQPESVIESVLKNKTYKVVDEISVHFWDKKYNQLCKFTINANAIYTVTAKYLRSDAIDFSDSLDIMSGYINRFIDIINTNHRLVFNPNFTTGKIPNFDKNTTIVSNVKVNVKWNSIVTQQQFAYVNEVLQEFYTAGIAEPRILSTATPNIINIKIKKGITQRVNKFFLKKRVEAKNYYIIYHDVKSNDVWNIRYGGKNINIENNLTDITFEFVNIADREFVRTINYMLYIINEVANRSSKIGKESIIKNLADNTKKGAMKKMKALDPKLYNFSVPGSTKAVKYSRICQKKFRPVNIYTKDEFDLMAKEKQSKLHQFINYTTGEPVWYECPKSLPYFGFITGKHPAGYCVPKCKISETEGIKNRAIRDSCTKQFNFESKSPSAGMLKFGKALAMGKVGFLHEKIYSMINLITGNKDIHLFMKSVSPTYANVPGSKIICCFAEQIGKPEFAIINDCIDYLTKLKNQDVELIGVLTEMLKGDSSTLDDMYDQFAALLQQVYDVHIVYINTSISVQNEILNSQNSSVYFSMDPSCSTYLSNSKNVRIVIIQRLYDSIYPVLYAENRLNKTSNESFASKLFADKQNRESDFIVGRYNGLFDANSDIIDILHKAITKGIIHTEHEVPNKPFTYSSIKRRLADTKYTKHISNGKICYLVTNTAKAICIGISNSINITEEGITEDHDVLVRKNYDLPFDKLSDFLSHFKSLNPSIIVLKEGIYKFNGITDDDTAIGLRIKNINCWFNDTKVSKVKAVYPNADCIAMMFEPSDVNTAIAKRIKPKIKYTKDVEITYYNMYIYMLLRYEIYKFLLLTRNNDTRNLLLKTSGDKEFIDIMNTIKQENRDDYHKLMNVFNNSNNIKTDLNKLLLNSDIEYIINMYTTKSHEELTKIVGIILNGITKKVDEPSGNINNVIVSYIEYGSHKEVLTSKHEEDIFYVNNRIKVVKDKYDLYINNIANDIKNKLLFTYEMNNFNIFFVINYFQFIAIPGTTIHIQFL